jgi:hypothetical protein
MMTSAYRSVSICVACVALGCSSDGAQVDTSQDNRTGTEAGGDGASGTASIDGAAGSPTSGSGGSGGTSVSAGTAGVVGMGGGTGGSLGKAGSGGTGGTTGGAGAGGGANQVVMPCSNLPSSTDWEKINPPEANPKGTYDDGTTEQVRVDPIESGTVWLGVHNRGLFKSTDCGASWKHTNTGRNGSLLDHGSWWSTVIDPTNNKILYAINGYGAGGLWKSTDGGVDWDQTIPGDSDVGKTLYGNFTNEVAMDPTDPKHLIVTPHGSCSGLVNGGCVGETTDGGATWRAVKSPANGEGGGPYMLDKNTWLMASGGLNRTSDGGATWQQVAPSGAQAMGGGNPLYRSDAGTYFIPAIQGVLKSDDGLSWSLLPCGRTVGFTGSDANLYGGDQWSSTYRTASLKDPTKWTTFPTPKGLPDGYGPPYMAYDRGHKLLYSSNFFGGVWRVVTP